MPDPIDRQLQTLADTLTKAWLEGGCQTCPLGEMAALAAATLAFYRGQERNKFDHWTNYRTR